jgi:hypothetical protein
MRLGGGWLGAELPEPRTEVTCSSPRPKDNKAERCNYHIMNLEKISIFINIKCSQKDAHNVIWNISW